MEPITHKMANETPKLTELRLNTRYYFMKYLSPMQLTEYELERLKVVEQTIHENEFIDYYNHTRKFEPAMIPFKEEDRITKEDREPEWICIRGETPMQELVLMIENLVYVTHLCYAYNRKRFIINLETFAVLLAKYGVEYSTDKFAKITLRLRGGPSHLFFGSGAMLETGAYNSIIARKSLNQTLCLLQDVCGFENIQVSDRRCENIVAKGTLKFELCLHLLKDTYPSYVQYNTSNVAGAFVGAIIRLKKIVTHQKKPASHRVEHKKKKNDHGSMMKIENSEKKGKMRKEYYNNNNNNNNNNLENHKRKRNSDEYDSDEEDDYYDDDDDDDDDDEDDDDDDDDDEEEEEDEIEQDENFDDYEFLEVDNNDIINNSGFEYYNIPENIIRDSVDEDEIKAINAIASAGSQHNKRARKRKKIDINTLLDPNNIDGFVPDETVKAQNITIIIFEKGRTICAGCKKTRSVYINCDKVRMMLYTCRKTPANLARERELKLQSV